MPTSKKKVAVPDTYDGKKQGQEAEKFLEACELYFFAHTALFTQETEQIEFALSYLSGTARSWARPIRQDLVGGQRNKTSYQWAAFRETFLKMFGEPDKERSALLEYNILLYKIEGPL